MENASKALIIAGAILISILLIGVGMFIFSSAQEPLQEGVGQMSESAMRMFNQKFENYQGSQKGSSVRSLISTVITSNSQNADERKVKINGVEDSTGLSAISNKINSGATYIVELIYTGALISEITVTGTGLTNSNPSGNGV